jgi:succinoglycan biosynthesis protein ExoM
MLDRTLEFVNDSANAGMILAQNIHDFFGLSGLRKSDKSKKRFSAWLLGNARSKSTGEVEEHHYVAREICVCIATHRRPQQLERLLRSLTEQQEAPSFEVAVVDNDVGRSAEAVAANFQDRLSLTYQVEPVRGLARARNRTVAASTSKFLAFVDDDEWASPCWLAAHYRVATEMNAAAVIGRTDVLFADEVPDYIKACGLFNSMSVADGEVVPWYFAHTGNSFVRRDALPHSTAPFSASFDLTGGEDVHLFRRMVDDGALVVAASAALIFEYRPASRANLYWIVRRSLRSGGTLVEIDWVSCHWKRRLRLTLSAGRDGASDAAKAGLLWHRDKTTAAQHLVWACQSFGKVFRQLGIRIEEYRHHH